MTSTTGKAFGVTILAFFAIAWTGWGFGGHLPFAAQLTVMILATAASAVLTVVAWRQASRQAPEPPGTERPDIQRRFGRIVAIEWIAIVVAAVALGVTHHPDLIPAVVCAGVGLHFVPLARLFGVPLYHATAAVMCALAVATFALAPGTPALWNLLPGVGAAATLYATCAALLTRGADRSVPVSR